MKAGSKLVFCKFSKAPVFSFPERILNNCIGTTRSLCPLWPNYQRMWDNRAFWPGLLFAIDAFISDATYNCIRPCFYAILYPDHFEQSRFRTCVPVVQSSCFILSVGQRSRSIKQWRYKGCCRKLSGTPPCILYRSGLLSVSFCQQAAGTLLYLHSIVLPKLVYSPSDEEIALDLSNDFVKGLEWLMLAQAQECSWQMAKISTGFEF